MAKTDETHELIRIMSPNEKRFFRLSSGRTGKETNYLRVFAAMDGMSEFDQEKLGRKLGGRKLNLSYEKGYLHKQLLRSLRHFYSDGNSAMALQDILKSLEILYRKRAGVQCQKLIDKGLEICRQFEQWNYHLELIDWQYRLYARTGNYQALAKFEESGFREKEALMRKIHLYSLRYGQMCFVMSVLQQKSDYMSAPERARFEQLRLSCNEQTRDEQHGFRITDLSYATQSLIHHYLGDLGQSYLWSAATQQLYREHPRFMFDLPFKYFAAKCNIINRCINLEKHAEALKQIDELKKFVAGLEAFDRLEITDEYQVSVISWQSHIYFKMRQPAEALKAARAYEREVDPRRLRQNLRLFADSGLSRIYFTCGMYKESLKYVNKQIREGLKGLKLDYLLFAFLLRMCIHAEEDDPVLLDSMRGALERFMKKHQVKDEFAHALTGFIRKYGATPGEKARQQLCAQQHGRLKKLVTAKTSQYEVILEWMKAKAERSGK